MKPAASPAATPKAVVASRGASKVKVDPGGVAPGSEYELQEKAGSGSQNKTGSGLNP